MEPIRLFDWGHRIRMIDGYDLNMPSRTGIYVLEEEELTLIETGPSPSVPYILKGLEELGHRPEDVRNVIVTHIHLDHAGGAGLLLKSCPEARVVVHPRGARHLADPSRLIQGARMVYGDQFDALFDPVLPIGEERILVRGDGEKLAIGPDRTLTFLDSPGHAAHHFTIHDPVSNGLFTGDTAGIHYAQTEEFGFRLYLPSTSPNQFDPDAMKASIERFRERRPERIFFGHFGMSEEPAAVFEQVKEELEAFMEIAERSLAVGEGAAGMERGLKDRYRRMLMEKGVPEDHPVFRILYLDLTVCAMGLEHYLNRKNR
ncbi:glyoxylase-like metal-dependent hydrolase (beta-lactamase superfamily II) [Melghirimyces profundicolus]|uniref:Glyoxylase-like metal-dependent hydrolase (Beta-lactamase superfamily II) n=1 Tax=Melghirimyces profundicolus TaxID=1242148 RepID=A0A2T6BSY3_9BACL|nr:MBL fold metallo-hydrolase [Melghirimyces profundicolus]PTX59067.1 glyoxylase-like metal-dependent hydrolase (beta-lactamase superfamily II) [Melghirimyces profundicolus]